MFASSSAHALGYSNSAVMIALIRELRRQGVLSAESTENVLRDAIGLLKPTEHTASVKEAIAIISVGLKENIAKG